MTTKQYIYLLTEDDNEPVAYTSFQSIKKHIAQMIITYMSYMKCDLILWKYRVGHSISREDLQHTPLFSMNLHLPFQMSRSLLTYLLDHQVIEKKHRHEIGNLGRVKTTYLLATRLSSAKDFRKELEDKTDSNKEKQHYRFFIDQDGHTDLEETTEDLDNISTSSTVVNSIRLTEVIRNLDKTHPNLVPRKRGRPRKR